VTSAATPSDAYGPSALATPANYVTVARLLVAPIVFVMIMQDTVSWLTWGAWTVLAFTDGLDGYLARRHGRTRSGAFLDPLADKVLVLGGLFALVAVDRFWWVPVAVIAARELAVSLFRVYWGRRGIAVPASPLAKVKTFAQALAVGAAVWPVLGDDPAWVADATLWVAVVLSVVSGVQYLVAGSRAGTTMHADG
jgi:CDP-diacylglycerol--glycerol-3-phosphate 3-phosphatidyltransferase